MMRRLFFLIIVFNLTWFVRQAIAQTSAGVPISQDQFNRLSEELDYSKTKKSLVLKKANQEEKKSEEEEDLFGQYNDLSVFEVLAFLVILILVMFIIYVVFSNIKNEKKVAPADPAVVEKIEDIEEINAVVGYHLAMADGDYRLAIRMQFIKVLQYLSSSNCIVWRPNKTNRHYLGEISDEQHYQVFKELAYIYDLVWYGHTIIDLRDFERIDLKFQKFLAAHL